MMGEYGYDRVSPPPKRIQDGLGIQVLRLSGYSYRNAFTGLPRAARMD